MTDDQVLFPQDGKPLAFKEVDGVRYINNIPLDPPGDGYAFGLDDFVRAQAADTFYALIGLRAKPGVEDVNVDFTFGSVICSTNDAFEWAVFEDPTVAGTFTYSDVPGSSSNTQVAPGDTAGNPSTNTVTGGVKRFQGYGERQSAVTSNIRSSIPLDQINQIVLAVRPLTNNADFQGGLVWRETK